MRKNTDALVLIPAVTQCQLQMQTLHRSSKEASVKCSGWWRVVNLSLPFLSCRMVCWWMNLGCQRSLRHKCFISTMDTMNYTFWILLGIFFILYFWRTCPSSVTLISLHSRTQYEWLVVFFLWRKLFYYWLLLMENSSQFPSVEASLIAFDFRILWTK